MGFRAPYCEYCEDEKLLRPGERGENLGERVGGGEAIGDAVLRAKGTGFEVLVPFSPFILVGDLPVISWRQTPSQMYGSFATQVHALIVFEQLGTSSLEILGFWICE